MRPCVNDHIADFGEQGGGRVGPLGADKGLKLGVFTEQRWFGAVPVGFGTAYGENRSTLHGLCNDISVILFCEEILLFMVPYRSEQ